MTPLSLRAELATRPARLSLHPCDDEILAVVDAWLDDLAQGDYESAFARTEHDGYHGWSPELMQLVVAGYGLPTPHPSGEVFSVSSRQTAPGEPFNRTVDRSHVARDELAEVWHDLPLDGEWSDLTVTFSVERRSDHAVLVLKEIHVF